MAGNDTASTPAQPPAPGTPQPAPVTPTTPPAPVEQPPAPAPEKKSADTALAPATLALKLPKELEGADLTEFTKAASELGLDSPRAQKLLDMHHAGLQAWAQAQTAHREKEQATWTAALKTDQEIGGAGFEANQQVARKALEKFGTPELKSWLAETGLGNHPELVRAFYRAGKAISEDSVAGTSGGGLSAADEDARLRREYPSMFQQSA